LRNKSGDLITTLSWEIPRSKISLGFADFDC
jgi:hypothetical protein